MSIRMTWQILMATLFLSWGSTLIAADRQSIYVPGDLRNGIYVQPHFIYTPGRDDGFDWDEDGLKQQVIPPKMAPPTLNNTPSLKKPMVDDS